MAQPARSVDLRPDGRRRDGCARVHRRATGPRDDHASRRPRRRARAARSTRAQREGPVLGPARAARDDRRVRHGRDRPRSQRRADRSRRHEVAHRARPRGRRPRRQDPQGRGRRARAHARRDEVDPVVAGAPATWLSDMLVNELHVDLPAGHAGRSVRLGDHHERRHVRHRRGFCAVRAARALPDADPRARGSAAAVGRRDRAEVRPVLRLCATFDHRIIDGAAAGRFAAPRSRPCSSPPNSSRSTIRVQSAETFGNYTILEKLRLGRDGGGAHRRIDHAAQARRAQAPAPARRREPRARRARSSTRRASLATSTTRTSRARSTSARSAPRTSWRWSWCRART